MKLQVPMPNSFFRIGLLLMIAKVLFSFSSIVEVSYDVDMVISLVACLFFAGSIIQKRYTAKTWMTFLLFMMLTLFTSYKTGNLMIFIPVLTCLAMCGEDLDKTIEFFLFWEGLWILVIIVVSVIMYTCGVPMVTLVAKEDWRYNFGFSHPNNFAGVVTNLFAMYLWLHFSEVRIRHLLVISVITLIIYVVTACRTALIVVAFLEVCVFLLQNSSERKYLLRFGAAASVPVLSCIFYICVRLYTTDNQIVRLLDSLLSTRIKQGSYAYNHYGISFWGQNLGDMIIKWDPYWELNAYTFDNVYTYLMMTQLVWLVVICLLLYRVSIHADTKRCIFLLSWVLYGISEIDVINPYLFFVILLVTELFDEAKCKKRIINKVEKRTKSQRGTP